MAITIKESQHLSIPFEHIDVATEKFRTIIGKGGYGFVYEGQLLLSGKLTTVAVKRLNKISDQGFKEFLTEIKLLSRYKHPNLISLLGFCEEGNEKILIYEHAVRGSLDKYLSSKATSSPLTWSRRINICIDAARGLDYLHNHVGKSHRIIHRDIKSANILLDQSWKAMISDLGLSKIGRSNENDSYLITNACGTHGYCDPVYRETGILTKESDVYSFGVVLFEVLCGRLSFMNVPNERRFLDCLAQRYYETGRLDELIDVELKDQIGSTSLNIIADIAYQCLQNDREKRPSMGLVLEKLEEARESQISEHTQEQQIMSGPAIGIDLGTTYSFGVWQHDRVEIIANDQGNRSTPSYVAFTDSKRFIGDGAKNQVAMNPTNTVFGFDSFCGLLCGGRSSKKKKEPLGNDSGLFNKEENDSGLFKKEENDSGLFKKEVNDSQFTTQAMARFLDDMEREKPIRFTSQHLIIATDNFTIKLGSSGFGTVYKGIISNNTPVAVKVLNGTSDKTIEQQFMAEMSTMGRTHHFNLIKLYGFCFESGIKALVYEFMVNGSLDNYLFKADKKTIIGFEKLHEIALGTARGITYLHEECHQRIVHYDIKPGNILLDSNFCAKVADFGLAKLCDKDSSRMTGRVGTPGYTAPEVWTALPVTHKCDVYSFGMLLFEIIGKRRNMDTSLGESQKWFPGWAWGKYEKKQLKDLMIACGSAKEDEEVAERMLKVAFCCVQYKPETRPEMSIVVKMLEGALEVPEPLNPFTHLFSGGVSEAGDSLAQMAWNVGGSDFSSSEAVSKSTIVTGTPSIYEEI